MIPSLPHIWVFAVAGLVLIYLYIISATGCLLLYCIFSILILHHEITVKICSEDKGKKIWEGGASFVKDTAIAPFKLVDQYGGLYPH